MKKLFYAVLAITVMLVACKKDKNEQQVQPLTVKNFWPNSGNAGTIVTIAGTGFKNADQVEVLFNGTTAQIMDARDSVIKVLAPAGGTTGIITLKQAGVSKEIGQYTFQVLSLSGISPSNGPAGTNISIRGMGFGSLNGPVKVMINGKEAVVTSSNDTMVVAAVPVAAGSGKIAVLVDGKEVTGPDFLFQHISAIKPLKGGEGTKVTITGEGFSLDNLANQVMFNGKAATVISSGSTQLVVTAPEGVATGPVTVTINGQQTVGSNFTVIPVPVITSVAPLSGPAGADVTIKGDYFSTFTDEVKITFNGIPATVSSTTDKQIVVKVPAGAGTGKINLVVNDQPTEGPEFKEQNLGIALLTPDNGMDGDVVTIKGIGFSTTPADNKVFFNGLPATVTGATATELTVTVPANVTTGVVTVTVGSLSATGPLFGRAGVITLAGGPTNTDLQGMNGIAVDSKGNVFVATGNNIRKITPGGVISLFAGSTATGLVDGTGANARFNYIQGVAIDNNDDIYVGDRFNNRIRKITPAGVVTTVGTVSTPISMASDPLGNIYFGQDYNGVSLFNKATGGSTKVLNQLYESGAYIAPLSPSHVVYTSDTWDGNYTVIRAFNGVKSFYINTSNQWGYADGTYATALFNNFSGIAATRDGNTFYILNNGALRRATDNTVTTIIGFSTNGFPPSGHVDGSLGNARFNQPKNLCIDKDGNLYIADVGNRAVRKVFFK